MPPAPPSLLVLLFCTLCAALAQSNGSTSSQSEPSAVKNITNSGTSFWLESIKHQGVVAFQKNSTYQVFRNVMDFGAKGIRDGISDDTAAINLAISSGGRCGPGSCQSSTTTPAVVYFPAGVYLISSPIIDYYYTQIIGNPNDLPVIKGATNFTAFALIDGNQYQPGNAANPAGSLGFNATNTFYRQIRNLILDTTGVSSNVSVNCIHWPTAQATSLQNLVFRMSEVEGTQHQGLLIEAGSGGFMGDLEFFGGLTGAVLGNQQFTSRNLAFNGAVTAINQVFDWGWTYKSIKIRNCKVGLNMTSGGALAQTVGSVTFIDSFVEDTSVAIWTSHTSDPSSYSNGSLVLENVSFRNVSVAVQGSQNTTLLSGATGSMNVEAWGQGHLYNPEGPYGFQGTMSPFPRPDSLVKHGKYYERSKPSYARTPPSQFISVRNYGAKGNGLADDTAALQKTILAAASAGKLVFVDAGTYRVSETIYIPGGSKIVGESFSVIMASGPIFANMSDPKAVVRVGKPREVGHVEWSDMVVATQGPEAGAVLIEWNLASHGQPSGMWDVHTRIGGFAGSKLELADCPATPNTSFGNRTLSSPSTRTSDSSISHGMTANVTIPPVYSNGTAPSARNSSNVDLSYLNKACIGAFMSMHVTKSATGLYMENNWLWTADHSLDTGFTNITVYSGRGLYIESERGNLWVVASSVEHHALYQYQLADTQSIFMGQIQTETAYYQPHPDIRAPFPAKKSFNDPNDAAVCQQNGTNCDGWALRIVNSQDINVYGAGFYSFFNNYNTSCSYPVSGETCQTSIFSIEGPRTKNVNVYNLNTIGATNMIDKDGVSMAQYSDNLDVFPDNIAIFRSG